MKVKIINNQTMKTNKLPKKGDNIEISLRVSNGSKLIKGRGKVKEVLGDGSFSRCLVTGVMLEDFLTRKAVKIK